MEVLIGELSALSGHNFEHLPELKKKKVVLASRLGTVDWSQTPLDLERFDLDTLKSLVSELEVQANRQIENHLHFIGNQLLALQEEHQYWRECLNVSFRKFCETVPAN